MRSFVKGSERELLGGSYAPITTAFVVVRGPEGTMLLYNRYRKLWELPGGMIEPGESPRQCAVRECLEESGQTLADVRFVGLCELLFAKNARRERDEIAYAALYSAALPAPAPFAPNHEQAAMRWWRPGEELQDACAESLSMIALAPPHEAATKGEMAVRLCVIGCGGIARTAHLPALRDASAEGLCVLAACCDVDESRAQAFREAGGFAAAYADFRAMLAAEKPDGCLVLTPFAFTPAIASAVLRQGVPALIEKPPAETLAACAPLVEAARHTGSQVAFNRRHMPLTRAMADGMRGAAVEHIDYTMYRVARWEPFHTTAIHGIDVVSYLAGSPYREARLFYDAPSGYQRGAVNMHIHARMQNGASARLSFIVGSGLVHERFLITGGGRTVEGAVPVWNGADTPGRVRMWEGGALVREVAGDNLPMHVSNGFLHQLHVFLDSLRTGAFHHGVQTALQSVDIAEALARRADVYAP